MSFMIFCGMAGFVVQLVILFHPYSRCRKLRYLSLLLLECLPLGGALYYGIKRPSVPLGWEFSAAICLWVAGAVLLGYILAWGVYMIKSKSK